MAPKAKKIETVIVEAKDGSFGRLASVVAGYLQGKHLAPYKRHTPAEVIVKVQNIRQIHLTRPLIEQKVYKWSTMRPGGLKEMTFREKFEKNPEQTFRKAVFHMLPQNKLRNVLLKHLIIV